MPEQHTSISEARKNLPKLSQAAKARMDRYIITHQGQPQSVLLGFKEYQGMKAAIELAGRPELMEDIEVGLKDFESGGERLSPEEARKRLAASGRSSKIARLAAELGQESGVDAEVVANILDTFIRRVGADISLIGQAPERASALGLGIRRNLVRGQEATTARIEPRALAVPGTAKK